MSTQHIVMREGKAYIARKGFLKAEMVARMYTDGDSTIPQVAEHYGLTLAEVHAALTYYYDNQTELDALHERAWYNIRQTATSSDQLKTLLAERHHQKSQDNLG